MPTKDLRCTECRWFAEDVGFGGSEVTGSTPPTIECNKFHWSFDFADARGSLRVIAEKGASCKDFEAAQ